MPLPGRKLKSAFLALTVLGASTVATGCYSFVPTRMETLAPGSSVRMEISGTAVDRLRPMRFTSSPVLEGIVSDRADGRFNMDAMIRTVDAAGITAIHTQRLNLADEEVRAVSFRRLDVLRTGIAAGGVALVIGGTLYVLLKDSLGRTGEYEPPLDFAPTLGWSIPVGRSR